MSRIYRNPVFDLPSNYDDVFYNDDRLPNDIEIHRGISLIRRIRNPHDGKKQKNGNVILQSQLGRQGGEGTVYECNIQNKVCKIYHPERTTKFRADKLVEMLKKKIKIRGVCWPEEILYNDKKNFVGYLMNKAKGHKLQIFMNPMEIKDKFPNWRRKQLVDLCISILEIVEQLHKSNIIIGDINANNILVEDYNKVYFIDCDSFQIGHYPCPVGTAEFTPREIQGKKYSEFLRTKEHDMFAVTILIFMILFLGKHPYSCKGGGSPAENVRKGNFPYKFGDRKGEDVPDGNWKFIWNNLPRKMKEIFEGCFADNKKPSIKDLRMVLKLYRDGLEKHYNYSNEILPTQNKKVPNEIAKKYKNLNK
ncbi:hypothetical protein [uncultured Brachyspira sp.]|uniref:protein kinase domain-containing protein n=1 Tax=uncultured Brachyspira sp. TaxID=221953 RepID=UPI002595A9B6|nr:hypothetical protein [uncultured Brachyspira sp.]